MKLTWMEVNPDHFEAIAGPMHFEVKPHAGGGWQNRILYGDRVVSHGLMKTREMAENDCQRAATDGLRKAEQTHAQLLDGSLLADCEAWGVVPKE